MIRSASREKVSGQRVTWRAVFAALMLSCAGAAIASPGAVCDEPVVAACNDVFSTASSPITPGPAQPSDCQGAGKETRWLQLKVPAGAVRAVRVTPAAAGVATQIAFRPACNQPPIDSAATTANPVSLTYLNPDNTEKTLLVSVSTPQGTEHPVIEVVCAAIGHVTATPSLAATGTHVSLGFDVVGSVVESPTVTVNGHAAVLESDSAGHYTYGYVVTNSDPDGPATIGLAAEVSGLGSRSLQVRSALSVDHVAPGMLLDLPTSFTWYQTAPVGFGWDTAAADLASSEGVCVVTCFSGDTFGVAVGLDDTVATEGRYILSVRGTDKAGNVGEYASTSFGIDLTSPIVSIEAQDAFLTTTVEVGVVASDWGVGQSGLDRIMGAVDGGPWTTMTLCNGAVDCSQTLAIDVPDGTHTLTVRAIDVAGNESPGATNEVHVKSVPFGFRSVTASCPVAATGKAVTLWMTLTEPVSSVDRVLVNGHSVGVTTVTDVLYTCEYTVTCYDSEFDPVLVYLEGVDLLGETQYALSYGAFGIDHTYPSLSAMWCSEGSPTNNSTVEFLVLFSEPVVNVAADQFLFQCSGTASGTISSVYGNEGIWHVVISSVTGDGLIGVRLVSDPAITDVAGNPVTVSDYFPYQQYIVDHTPPSVSIGPPSSSIVSGGPVHFDVTYNGADAVTLSPSDVVLNGTGDVSAQVGIVAVAADVYRVELSQIRGDGQVSISLSAGTASDAALNLCAVAGPSAAVAVDNTPPHFLIESPQDGFWTSAPQIELAWTASEEVTSSGLVAYTTFAGTESELSVESGTTVGLEGRYTLQVSGSDAAGNSTTTELVHFGIDRQIPHIAASTSMQSGVAGSTLTLVCTEDSPVESGVEVAYWRVDGGGWSELRDIADDGIVTAPITGLSSGEHVLDAWCVDRAGNCSSTATVTVVWDDTPPMVESVSVVGANPTNASTTWFAFRFSEPVIGVSSRNFTVRSSGASGTLAGVTGQGSLWTVEVDQLSGDGTIAVDLVSTDAITDTAGNALETTTSGPMCRVDRIPPVLISLLPTDQNPTSASIIHYAATFSEGVVGVSASNFSAVGTSVTGVVTEVAGAGAMWTVTVSSIVGQGTLGIDLANPAGITDTAGNALASTWQGTPYAIDVEAPALVIDEPSSAPAWFSSVPQALRWHTECDDLATSDGFLGWTTFDGAETTVAVEDGSVVTSEGRFLLWVTGSDQAGNTGYAARSFGIDLTSPTVSVSGPARTRLTTVTLSVVAGDSQVLQSGMARVEYLVDSSSDWMIASVYAGETTVTLDICLGVLPAGEHTIAVRAWDVAGNVSDVASAVVQVDDTAPTFSGFAASPSRMNVGLVQIGFVASEPLGDNPSVTVNGGATTLMQADGTSYVYSYTVSTTDLEGSATILVAGTDLTGNTGSTTDTDALFIDRTAPMLVIDEPTSAPAWFSSVPQALHWHAECDDLATSEGSLGWTTFDGAETTVAVEDGSVVTSEGRFLLWVTGTDRAGNTGYAAKRFGIDPTSPTVSVSGPGRTKLTTVTLSVVAGDSQVRQSGIVRVEYRVDGSPDWTIAALYAGDTTVTLDISLGVLPAGAHTIAVRAWDVAGNVSDVMSAVVQVDDTAPTFSGFAASPSRVNVGPVQIGFVASEPLGGDPSVTVNGGSATLVQANGESYVYSYTVSATDLEGSATIVVAGTDLTGNTGSTTDTDALFIDRTAPMLVIDEPTSAPEWFSSVPQVLRWHAECDDLATSEGFLGWTAFDGAETTVAVEDGSLVTSEGRFLLWVTARIGLATRVPLPGVLAST